jgi:hypothetical protein
MEKPNAKYVIIYFAKNEDGSLFKEIQFEDTYDEVKEFLQKTEFVNDIYYVLEVSKDLTRQSWDYMINDLEKKASYEK